MSAETHWELLALRQHPERAPGVLVGVRGQDGAWLRCGHLHTEDEAYACPWEPVPYPEGATMYVREVRTEVAPVQAEMPWAPLSRRVHGRTP